MLGNDVTIEGATDEIQHVLPTLKPGAIAAASIVDGDIFSEDGRKIRRVARIDRAKVAVLELLDLFKIRQLLHGEFHLPVSPKFIGASPMTATVAIPFSTL